MPKFETELVVQEIDDSTWRLKEDLVYKGDIVDLVYVPAGFITDFASVPRVPFIFDVLGDIAHRSAVLHDYLYYCGNVSRYTADRVLLEAMKVDGVAPWKRQQIFWGVRIGGWKAWNEHRKAGHSSHA